jgi:hypothetical protein
MDVLPGNSSLLGSLPWKSAKGWAWVSQRLKKKNMNKEVSFYIYIYIPKAQVNTTKESNLIVNNNEFFVVGPEKGSSEAVIRMSLHYFYKISLQKSF